MEENLITLTPEKKLSYSTPIIIETNKEKKNHKNILFTILKIAISSFLIIMILNGTDIKKILTSIQSANFLILGAAFSLHIIGSYLSASRWKLLLKTQNVDVKLNYLIKSHIVSIFFNHFLPSTIGGDTVRAYDSYKVSKRKFGSMAVIFVDRFLGLFALMFFALASLFFASEITSGIPLISLWIILGFFGMALVIWIIFLPSVKLSNIIQKIHFPYSSKVQNIVDRIINAFLSFKGEREVLFKALLFSFILQLNVVFYYYLISLALNLQIPFYSFLLIVPLSIFIMMLPVTINGIGLRENVFFFFLAAFAVAKPEAIAFAWIEYGILVLLGLLGGIIYLFRR
jgi:uncharacterized protein (TIRG00374 family)